MGPKGLEELIVEIEKRLGEDQLELFKLELSDKVKTFRDRVLSHHNKRHLNRDFNACLSFAEALISRYQNKFEDEDSKWNFIAELGELLTERRPSKIFIFKEKHPIFFQFLKWFFNLLFPPIFTLLLMKYFL